MAEFNTFDLGRVIQTAEAIKGLKRQSSIDALQERYLGQRIEAGEQEMARNKRQDEVVLGREKAAQLDAAAGYVLQAPNPKNFVEQNYPEFIKDIEAQGMQWVSLDDEGVKRIAQGAQAKARAELGIGPEKPSEFSLKPGETRYRGNQVIAAQPASSGSESSFTLGPGQTRYGPDGKPIASVAPAPDKAAADQTFSRADKLRDEYTTASKEFVGVGDAYSRIISSASDPSAAGDLALIFSYMKILDPGSVVREQEFANAQNAAGVPDRIRAQYNKVLNGERLAGPQRADFVAKASQIYKSQAMRHEKTVKSRYNKLATEWGIDPKYVVSDYSVDEPQQPAQQGQPKQIASDADYAQLPSGTRYIAPDGSERVKR